MAIGAGDGGASRGPHMREEEMRPYVAAQMAEIFIRPGGTKVPEQTRLKLIAVPSESKAVAVRTAGGFQRIETLLYQGMRRLGDVAFKRDRVSAICNPSAHERT